MLLTFLANFTVFIFARCFSIWLTFVMHLWSRFSSVVWKIYRYFNVLHSLFLCLRYWRCAEISRRRIARVELALRRIVPSPSWRRRVVPFRSWPQTCVTSLHPMYIWNSLPNSIVDACTVNAFKARSDKFWQQQLVKFDFTADLTGTRNRSEEVIKWYCLFMIAYNDDADLEMSETCVHNSLLSWELS